MSNRIILAVSLAGMILAVHLWVQKARWFDRGCLGLGQPAAVVVAPDAGCLAVEAGPANQLLGVSNVAWGYAFFLGMALLSLTKSFAPGEWPRRLHRLSEIAVLLASIYAGYLAAYQAFVIRAFCVLCLGLSFLVGVLLAVHIAIRRVGRVAPSPPSLRRTSPTPLDAAARAEEIGFTAAILFGGMGIFAAVVLFIDRIGTERLDQGIAAAQIEALVGQTLPIYIDESRLDQMRACRVDDSAPRIDLEKLVGKDFPALGRVGAKAVTVFYDPNCPHCREYHPQLLRLAEKYKDRAAFTVVPFMLWPESSLQVQALEVARKDGKYYELWRAELDHQPGAGAGMNLAQIEALFTEIGLPVENLEARLDAAKTTVMDRQRRLSAAGLNGAPSIYIDGSKVAAYNHSPECVGRLLGP